MRITRFDAGESVDDLVARVYGELKTKRAIRAAATSLRAANPGLRKPGALDDGARIVVPELSGAKPVGRATAAGDASADALLRSLRDEALQVADELGAAGEEMVEVSKLRVDELAALDFDAVKDVPEIREAIAEVEGDVELDTKVADVLSAHAARLPDLVSADADRITGRLR